MKTIFSAFDGALVMTEENGVYTLSADKEVGGGAAAGVIEGKGSIVLDRKTGMKLGEALLNSHLPTTVQPLAQVVEGIVEQGIEALE